MKIVYDPTGKVRKALPNLSDEDIKASVGGLTDYFKDSSETFTEQFHNQVLIVKPPREVVGVVKHTGEMYLYASDIIRLPLCKIKSDDGVQTVYLYQHGYVSFTWNEQGEHTSEIWKLR